MRIVGIYGNALQAASARWRNGIVQRLLEAGADVNAQMAGTALCYRWLRLNATTLLSSGRSKPYVY